MMRLPCPHCGTRDEREFRFGGEVAGARPSPDADDRAWTQYLFFRNNIGGPQLERWVHSRGCGRWFQLARDTFTHEILACSGDPGAAGTAPEESG